MHGVALFVIPKASKSSYRYVVLGKSRIRILRVVALEKEEDMLYDMHMQNMLFLLTLELAQISSENASSFSLNLSMVCWYLTSTP